MFEGRCRCYHLHHRGPFIGLGRWPTWRTLGPMLEQGFLLNATLCIAKDFSIWSDLETSHGGNAGDNTCIGLGNWLGKIGLEIRRALGALTVRGIIFRDVPITQHRGLCFDCRCRTCYVLLQQEGMAECDRNVRNACWAFHVWRKRAILSVGLYYWHIQTMILSGGRIP